MTYKKIAELAGVSTATVSKALSGSHEISPETVQRILRIAEDNGVTRAKYRRNPSLIHIAILVPEIISIYYSQNVTTLAAILENKGVASSVYILGFHDSHRYDVVDRIAADGMIDGILSLCSEYVHLDAGIPIVYTCEQVRNCSIHRDVVFSDMYSGILSAIEHLAHLGHRHIGFIGEKHTLRKQEMFGQAMKQLELGYADSDIYCSVKRFEEIGYEGAAYFLRQKERPTAYLTAYDEVALGAIHTFQSHGVRVPEDVSIIGINDIPSASYASVPLTTIRTFRCEMLELAVQTLLNKIHSPDNPLVQHTAVKCDLIIRDTTAPIQEK